jgi:hypothetical protein
VRPLLERFGDAAFRLRRPPESSARALLEALRRIPGVVDAVVTEEHALVTFAPGAPLSARLHHTCCGCATTAPISTGSRAPPG